MGLLALLRSLITRQMIGRKKRKKMEAIQNWMPQSKAELLQMALWFNNGNIGEAQKMVDYYAKNIELPDVAPVPPKFLDKATASVNGALGWVKENQETIAQVVDFVRGIVTKKGVAAGAGTPLPPIN